MGCFYSEDGADLAVASTAQSFVEEFAIVLSKSVGWPGPKILELRFSNFRSLPYCYLFLVFTASVVVPGMI